MCVLLLLLLLLLRLVSRRKQGVYTSPNREGPRAPAANFARFPLFAYTRGRKEVKQIFPDPNDDGVNESQPFGSHPDFEDDETEDLPLGDLEPGVAEANLAMLDAAYRSESAADEAW